MLALPPGPPGFPHGRPRLLLLLLALVLLGLLFPLRAGDREDGYAASPGAGQPRVLGMAPLPLGAGIAGTVGAPQRAVRGRAPGQRGRSAAGITRPAAPRAPLEGRLQPLPGLGLWRELPWGWVPSLGEPSCTVALCGGWLGGMCLVPQPAGDLHHSMRKGLCGPHGVAWHGTAGLQGATRLPGDEGRQQEPGCPQSRQAAACFTVPPPARALRGTARPSPCSALEQLPAPRRPVPSSPAPCPSPGCCQGARASTGGRAGTRPREINLLPVLGPQQPPEDRGVPGALPSLLRGPAPSVAARQGDVHAGRGLRRVPGVSHSGSGGSGACFT